MLKPQGQGNTAIDIYSDLIIRKSKIEAVIAVSGRSHKMRRFVCFLFLKQGNLNIKLTLFQIRF
jgi:hypothetical protein